MNTLVTEATIHDAPTVLKIMKESFKEYGGLLIPPSDVIREMIDKGGAVISWCGTKPVGCAHLLKDTCISVGY